MMKIFMNAGLLNANLIHAPSRRVRRLAFDDLPHDRVNLRHLLYQPEPSSGSNTFFGGLRLVGPPDDEPPPPLTATQYDTVGTAVNEAIQEVQERPLLDTPHVTDDQIQEALDYQELEIRNVAARTLHERGYPDDWIGRYYEMYTNNTDPLPDPE